MTLSVCHSQVTSLPQHYLYRCSILFIVLIFVITEWSWNMHWEEIILYFFSLIIAMGQAMRVSPKWINLAKHDLILYAALHHSRHISMGMTECFEHWPASESGSWIAFLYFKNLFLLRYLSRCYPFLLCSYNSLLMWSLLQPSSANSTHFKKTSISWLDFPFLQRL